jgi:methylated-DNA-protein-cysteine methyltransferase related protein
MSESFSARVWELATSIPPGRVTTYGILASAAGGGAIAARSITSILGKAPNQGAIPYHRIVYAGGRVWLPAGHEAARLKCYRREGITITPANRIENFDDVVYYFD